MSTDLKKDNNPKIAALLTVVILVCAGFQYGFSFLFEFQKTVISLVGSAACSAVLVLITNLLPHNIKHKLVFTRFKNEMPGGRVDKLCRQDARILYSDVETKWPDVFAVEISENERNSRWYRDVYKPVKDKLEVQQAHRNFLLYRDVLSGLISLIIGVGLWNVFGNQAIIGPIVPAVYYVLACSSLLTLIAARNAGHRFVLNAVAIAL